MNACHQERPLRGQIACSNACFAHLRARVDSRDHARTRDGIGIEIVRVGNPEGDKDISRASKTLE
jgi:hypothetical protein